MLPYTAAEVGERPNTQRAVPILDPLRYFVVTHESKKLYFFPVEGGGVGARKKGKGGGGGETFFCLLPSRLYHTASVTQFLLHKA